jgi:Bardet-Biedl syndrome 9 protein
VQITAQNQQPAPKDAPDFKLNLILNRNCASVSSLFEDVIESLNARGALGTNKK